MRLNPTVLLFLIAIVFGAIGGALIYGAYRQDGSATASRPESVSVAFAAPAPTATPAPPRDPLAVGSGGTFRNGVLVFVDDLGAWAYRRAEANRDGADEVRTLRAYQTFEIPDGTPVTITNRRDGMIQVEVVDGPLRGRRGWCLWPSLFVPNP